MTRVYRNEQINGRPPVYALRLLLVLAVLTAIITGGALAALYPGWADDIAFGFGTAAWLIFILWYGHRCERRGSC